MKENLLSILLSAIVLFGAGLVYILPLRKREKWVRWLPVMFLLNLLCMWLNYELGEAWWVLGQLLHYLCAIFMVNRCTKLAWPGACYCAVWICVTGEMVHELWIVFSQYIPELHAQLWAQDLSLLIFSTVCYLLLFWTVARWMPRGDIYQIGPRQLFSAFLLGSMCVTMANYFLVPHERDDTLSVIFVLCQIYCVSLLYLQTELFKKSEMQKELDALNFLYSCEQEQYDMACQNIRMVNRKCEELEQTIGQMQQYLPDAVRQELKRPMDDAMRACDTMVESGNGVLDIVLTEKKLLAETSGIQINCVADGKLLDFMEVVDIYAVFSNALDNAIEAVRRLTDADQRLIDLLVYESQNFLVINISNPLMESVRFEENLPVTTKARNSFHGYGLRVLARAVEKYQGMFTVEAKGGFFTLKVLIPLPQKE